MADVQTERAYGEQPTIFHNKKRVLLGETGNYPRRYNLFENVHKHMSMHLSPCCRDVQIGDIVTVGECQPLSKTVRFNVSKVTKAAGTKKQFQKF
ncbi:40S ribosomal protein S11-like [Ailuropoda melanoleuca]|uniref:40S ribosomal protein S11-like n=1 Tax=Ailuropoda melanoleuca TaxID=9646 RepID=UPI000947C3AA|nr:40S ribosomal protein S11-like [Ailuropoda melanoleuca]